MMMRIVAFDWVIFIFFILYLWVDLKRVKHLSLSLILNPINVLDSLKLIFFKLRNPLISSIVIIPDSSTLHVFMPIFRNQKCTCCSWPWMQKWANLSGYPRLQFRRFWLYQLWGIYSSFNPKTSGKRHSLKHR